MDAERFCEILTEEGFPLQMIKDLWNYEGANHAATEVAVRNVARAWKAEGMVAAWEKLGWEDE